jgi:heme oxygenase
VLTALRKATKTRHAILDGAMPLSQPDVGWEDYVQHLQILAKWLIPLENWLMQFSNGPQGERAPDFICYSDIIRADLGNLLNIQKENICSWMKSESAAYRWGICYVIEGSQLGGELLYKRLAARLSPHKLIYLQSKQAGRWPAFLKCMAQEITTQDQINSACEGAMQAFDALMQELPLREISL